MNNLERASNKIHQTKRGMMTVPLTSVDAGVLLKFAKTRAMRLRIIRQNLERFAKELQADMVWQPFETDEEYDEYMSMRNTTANFKEKLEGIISGERRGSDYTVEDVDAFDWYMKWMNEQLEFLYKINKELS